MAVFFAALFFLGFITTVTALVMFFTKPDPLAVKVILVGIGFSIVTWLVAFFKRRSAYCPLCKGTPLINSGALPHSKARRIFPLSHGITSIISILATQRFRCMYCGSDFDLLKTPSHLRGTRSDDEGD